MNTPDKSEMIDDWASRLIDGDIVLDDVSAEARDAVTMRAEQFRVVRETLLRSRDDAPTSTRAVVDLVMADVRPRRRLAVYITGVAAAAAVATIVGVAVSSSGRSDDSLVADGVATAPAAETQTKVADMEAALATEAPAAEPLSDGAGSDMAATTYAVGDACPDELRPTIIPVATIDGEDVEIHWSAAHGVVVYRISDCSIVLATTP
jgi:hypothetical protein